MKWSWPRIAFWASLPAFMIGGCDCGHGCSGCKLEPVSCDFREHCDTADECSTSDPCNVATCVDNRCGSVPATDGPLPPDQQSQGDCVTLVCQSGQLVEAPASDPPSIDDPCRIGACANGVAAFVIVDDGTPCTMGGGSSFCVGGRCLRFPDTLTADAGSDAGTGGSGTGGSGTGGGGTGGAMGTGGADAGTDGGTGGAGGGPVTCIGCSEVLYGGDLATLCEGSMSTYEALADCVCLTTCASVCGDTICNAQPATAMCIDCIASITDGCGAALTACNDDF